MRRGGGGLIESQLDTERKSFLEITFKRKDIRLENVHNGRTIFTYHKMMVIN